MWFTVRRILIVDSNSVLAMRVKVLLELIGCRVELLHFSMVDDSVVEQDFDLVAASHGVPTTVIRRLMGGFFA